MSIYVLYHSSCHDGFGAAYAAWKRFGDSARYIATNDRVNYPEFIPEGSEIYLLDFTFQRENIVKLREKMARVVVLDHHVTSQADLEGLSDVIFDMNRSASTIAWEYFHGGEVPLFLRYIEDRDIYRNALPFTGEITMYNFSLPFEFSLWDETCKLFSEIEKA